MPRENKILVLAFDIVTLCLTKHNESHDDRDPGIQEAT